MLDVEKRLFYANEKLRDRSVHAELWDGLMEEELRLSNASLDYFPGSILQGIQAIHVGKGIVLCKLIIEDRVL
ncbi:unnamed protein product, partial [Brassica oleracea]